MIVAAAQEERFTRTKHDASFPEHAILFCLREAKIAPEKIDWVVFYDKPFLKFERLLETCIAYAPRGFASFVRSLPTWMKDKLFQKRVLANELTRVLGIKRAWQDRLLFSEHHFSHAASAFYASPFDRAAVITMDGVGEWATTSVGIGVENSLTLQKEIHFPHSLGLLYSAFTAYLGFKVNSGEYKVMGLAPYGVPRYAQAILDNLIDLKADGSYALNMQYFDFGNAERMTNRAFHSLFGSSPRQPEGSLEQRHADLAASIQKVTEQAVYAIASDTAARTKEKNLCMAGGVALNSVANGKLLESGLFERIWVQPGSGDAGGAIGAALGVYYHVQENSRTPLGQDSMRGALLGPSYSDHQIIQELERLGGRYRTFDNETMLRRTAELLQTGKTVGWFQGRMEFGPRSLGARSILADPRNFEIKARLNKAVKLRESFRPFAPSILKEDVEQYFALDGDSDYMQFVVEVRNTSIPAVTHVDNTARVQTVSEANNPRFYGLLKHFKSLTGCPCLVNTSFNVRGEPIVQSPSDAFKCFMNTNLDALVIGNAILEKHEQTASPGAINFAPD